MGSYGKRKKGDAKAEGKSGSTIEEQPRGMSALSVAPVWNARSACLPPLSEQLR